mmetsp:Transcript_6213/g.16899  ORF Transcript_6213/g.16899 Transcript_6213/m.16899 type:complete len:259 (-) Transcript_6213:639-1415(-)
MTDESGWRHGTLGDLLLRFAGGDVGFVDEASLADIKRAEQGLQLVNVLLVDLLQSDQHVREEFAFAHFAIMVGVHPVQVDQRHGSTQETIFEGIRLGLEEYSRDASKELSHHGNRQRYVQDAKDPGEFIARAQVTEPDGGSGDRAPVDAFDERPRLVEADGNGQQDQDQNDWKLERDDRANLADCRRPLRGLKLVAARSIGAGFRINNHCALFCNFLHRVEHDLPRIRHAFFDHILVLFEDERAEDAKEDTEDDDAKQ